MKKIKSVFWIIIIIGSVIFTLVVTNKIFLNNDAGYKRSKICETINNSISKAELLRLIGLPERITKEEKGVLYYYKGTMFAAGPIRILLDTKENRVIGIKCFEDEEWKYFNKNVRDKNPRR